MARTRIEDLPKDVEIRRAESRAIMGGVMTQCPNVCGEGFNDDGSSYENRDNGTVCEGGDGSPVDSSKTFIEGVWKYIADAFGSDGTSSLVGGGEGNAAPGVRG